MKKLQFGETADQKMNWQKANDYCKSLGKGWRLPERWELVKAYDDKVDGFKSDYYWSSTTYVNGTGVAWIVNFFNGNVVYNGKTYNFYVRPVRGGQCVGNLKIKKSDIKREAVKLSKGMIGRLK